MHITPAVLRLRFQLIGALFFAVLVPGLFGPNVALWSPGTNPSQDNTIIATLIAVLVGFYFMNRLNHYPGIGASSVILATFFTSYTAVLVVLLFARLDYSRFQIGGSFLLCLVWFYFLYFFTNRIRRLSISVVPGGKVADLMTIKTVDWHYLSEPKLSASQTAVVADFRANLDDDWVRFLTDCSVKGIPVFHVKQLREYVTGRVEIDHISENAFGTLLPNLAYKKVKQIIDFIISLVLLPFLMPLLILISIVIKLGDRGPVFFIQERLGYQRMPIKVVKFRTMKVGSSDPSVLEDAITKDHDDRITTVGKFLRRTRLDELPQILNILAGQMSWIGPRPEATVLATQYDNALAFYGYRHIVKPGITGWAQVNQGHVADVEDVHTKLNYDFYYIKNYSPWLDMLIVLKTIAIVLTGKGAK